MLYDYENNCKGLFIGFYQEHKARDSTIVLNTINPKDSGHAKKTTDAAVRLVSNFVHPQSKPQQ